MMNLRHIEVFHAVYTNGSVSGAARALNVSQPSVSKVLRHAEIRLGFPLFLRAGGRLSPTEEAHTLFREVEEIYHKVGTLKQAAKNIERGHNGLIRVAVLPGFGLDIGPKAVVRFREKHPSVSFDIHTLHHADVLRALHERQCDITIGYDAPPHPRLVHDVIGTGELVMLFRRSDIRRPPERFSLRALDKLDFISPLQSGPLGALLNRELERLDLSLNEVVSVNTMYIAAPLVREGLGVAVVDSFTARACSSPEIDYRPFSPAIPFNVYCSRLADRPPSKPLQRFTDLLAQLMNEPMRPTGDETGQQPATVTLQPAE